MDVFFALFLSLFNIKIIIFFGLLTYFFWNNFNFEKRFFAVFFLFKIPFVSYIFKNIIFNILFAFIVCFYGFIGLLALFFSKYIYSINLHFLPKLLAIHLLFFSDLLLDLKVEIYGQMPKNAIIAPQHQSLLEIIAITAYIDKPVFVFKQSLLFIPFLGFFIKSIGMIPVNRKQHNHEWINLAVNAIKSDKNLVIFPEGTRTKFNENISFKKGVFKLAKLMNKKIVPVYINTGLFWPKWCFFKKSGTAILIFGEPIDADPEILKKHYKKHQKQLKNDQKKLKKIGF